MGLLCRSNGRCVVIEDHYDRQPHQAEPEMVRRPIKPANYGLGQAMQLGIVLLRPAESTYRAGTGACRCGNSDPSILTSDTAARLSASSSGLQDVESSANLNSFVDASDRRSFHGRIQWLVLKYSRRQPQIRRFLTTRMYTTGRPM